MAELPKRIDAGFPLYYDHVDQLERLLEQSPNLVLYCTDNSGEIYFDIPLYEYVKSRCRRLVLVVKGGPSVNDLTREELRVAGLDRQFDEVADTGTDGGGIIWDDLSKEMLHLMEDADLILSKGGANFETIAPKRLKTDVFFLFKVKCEPISVMSEAPMGKLSGVVGEWERLIKHGR